MDRTKEQWAKTYAEVRATLYSPAVTRWDEIDQAQFVVGNVLEKAIFALDGTEHRDRRRAESALFSKARRAHIERVLTPAICADVLRRARSVEGPQDLVGLIRGVGVRLATSLIGLDVDEDDSAGFLEIGDFARAFAVGAGVEESNQPKEQVLAEVGEALAAFEERYVRRAYDARRARLEEVGEASDEDLLSLLIAERDALGLTYDDVVREAGFYLAAASDTTAQSVAGLMHHVFEAGSEGTAVITDPVALQLWMHESLRVRSVVPLTHRRSIDDWALGDTPVEAGTKVHVDLYQGGIDPSVYGEDAATFDPDRHLPTSTPRFGFAFGGGVHACLGKALAAGAVIQPGAAVGDDHLVGVATTIAAAFLAAGIEPAPGLTPQNDPLSKRWSRFDSYPVVLQPVHST